MRACGNKYFECKSSAHDAEIKKNKRDIVAYLLIKLCCDLLNCARHKRFVGTLTRAVSFKGTFCARMLGVSALRKACPRCFNSGKQ